MNPPSYPVRSFTYRNEQSQGTEGTNRDGVSRLFLFIYILHILSVRDNISNITSLEFYIINITLVLHFIHYILTRARCSNYSYMCS